MAHFTRLFISSNWGFDMKIGSSEIGMKYVVIAILCAGISACSGDPSSSEIQAALASRVSRKGCASDSVFKEFPVSTKQVGQKRIFQPFIDNGFINEANGAYDLSEQGRAAYDKKYSGFCYTDHYIISDVAVVKKIERNQWMDEKIIDAWVVTLKISPSNVDEWIKNPKIIQTASLASLEKIADTKSFTVTMMKVVGKDKLIPDMQFSFNPGIAFAHSY